MEVDLRQLRAFEVLLRERNLTRAAAVLGVAQPALSKTLAKLRRYFADPLFVRAGHRMEPTAKALELAGAVHALLDDATMLRARHRPFDPADVDAHLLLQRRRLRPRAAAAARCSSHLEAHAPGVRLRVTPIEFEELEAALEAGLSISRWGRFAAARSAFAGSRCGPSATSASCAAIIRASAPSRRSRHSPPSATCSSRRPAPGTRTSSSSARSSARFRPSTSCAACRRSSPPRSPRAARTSSRRCPPVSRAELGDALGPARVRDADAVAANRRLAVLARAVSPRARQSMDPRRVRRAVRGRRRRCKRDRPDGYCRRPNRANRAGSRTIATRWRLSRFRSATAAAQPPPRVRGVIQAVEGQTLVVATPNDGVVRLTLTDMTGINGLEKRDAGRHHGQHVHRRDGRQGPRRPLASDRSAHLSRVDARRRRRPLRLGPARQHDDERRGDRHRAPKGRGGTMNVRHAGGNVEIDVTRRTEIVALTMGTRALLVPGATVMALAAPADGGATAVADHRRDERRQAADVAPRSVRDLHADHHVALPNRVDDVVAFRDLAEHRVLAVQVRRRHVRDEELAAVRVRARRWPSR